jgi:DNA-binding XRE family transcriptional regulator
LKISLAERGLYSPPIIEAQKIAKALGVEAEQLFPASFNKVEKK